MSYRADGSYDPYGQQPGATPGGSWQAGAQQHDAYQAAHVQAGAQYPTGHQPDGQGATSYGQQPTYSGGMQHTDPYGGQQPGVSSRVQDETYVASSGYGVAPDLFAPRRRSGRVLAWLLALGLAFGAGLAVGRATAAAQPTSEGTPAGCPALPREVAAFAAEIYGVDAESPEIDGGCVRAWRGADGSWELGSD